MSSPPGVAVAFDRTLAVFLLPTEPLGAVVGVAVVSPDAAEIVWAVAPVTTLCTVTEELACCAATCDSVLPASGTVAVVEVSSDVNSAGG